MLNSGAPKHVFFLISVIALLLTALLRFLFISQIQTPALFLENINEQVYHELEDLEQEQENIINKLNRKGFVAFRPLNDEFKYPFYLFRKGETAYWSNNQFVPNYATISGNYDLRFIGIKQGQYLVSKKIVEVDSLDYELFSFLPVFYDSPIDNFYFKSGFNPDLFQSSSVVLQTYPILEKQAIYYNDQYIFSIEFGPDYQLSNEPVQYIIVVLIAITLLSLLAYIVSWVKFFVDKRAIEAGFVFLAFGAFVIRSIMLYLEYPFSYVDLSLFNPIYYTSSAFNPSLGDLLLNSVFLLSLVGYVFRYFHLSSLYKRILKLSELNKSLVTAVLVLLVHYALFLQFIIIRSFYNNSTWSLDITAEIEFPFLKVICFLIFFVGVSCYFLVAHVVYMVAIKVNRKNSVQLLSAYAAGVFVYMTISLIVGDPFFLIALINAVYFGLLSLLQLPPYLAKVRYNSFLYLFVAAMVCALLGGISIADFEKRRMIEDKHRFANQLLLKNDVLGEYLLTEIISGISDDAFILSKMKSPFSDKEDVKTKIKQVYIPSYFDKYDTEVSLFDTGGEPFDRNQKLVNFNFIKFYYNEERNKTEHDDIYFVENPADNFSKEYITLITLKQYGTILGHVMITMKLKKVIPNSLYPELLVDKSFVQSSYTKNYSYAVYDKEVLAGSAGNFNYNRDFRAPLKYNSLLFETGIVINNYHHLAIDGADQKNIIITSPINQVKSIISNFSFLFMIFIFLTMIMLLILTLLLSVRKTNLNLSTRIQLYLNVAFFLPLLAVSISTLSLINSTYKEDVTKQYLDKAETTSNSMVNHLNDFQSGKIEIDQLSNHLTQIARLAEIDINLFETSGHLLSSSQPLIYEKGLMAEYINPEAYSGIIEQKYDRMILNEEVGELFFKTAYVGVKSFRTGELMAMIGIPYFESKEELDAHLIAGLTNIINIFTFVFIIFLAISYMASRVLTSPLQFIAQKLSKTTLSEYNEPIEWDTDDEIGLMVGEYNKMLLKLEESKNAIAQSEKESAWREMAKQVAHEIKNPLTPMKLTLQHLKRTFSNQENKEMIDQPINNLLQQVDTLSDIATSFSAFAKMPIPKNEKFEITRVIREASSLYSSNENSISLKIPDNEIYVIGDEKLMNRIFSNLIINGIQSVKSMNTPEIEIELHIIDKEKVLIKVKDNGEGIDPIIKDKVFIPNFSTKNEGSGIGLAIAKRGVEHAGGAIWFESELMKGTAFFIELPLAM